MILHGGDKTPGEMSISQRWMRWLRIWVSTLGEGAGMCPFVWGMVTPGVPTGMRWDMGRFP